MTMQHLFQRWLLAFAAFTLALTPLTTSPPAAQLLQEGAAGNYLILCADLFAGRLEDFIALKEAQGYAVTAVSLSQIGEVSQENILSFIKTWYAGKEGQLNFLLLVGDNNFIPVWPTGHSTGTDLYYATMGGGDDYVPDLYYGRLPFRNTGDLDQWISKILAYEQGKAGETWPRRASFIATDSSSYYQAVEAAHGWVIGSYTITNFTGSFPNDPQPGGDRLYPRTYGATGANVREVLNAGPALVVYNGLGSSSAWLGPAFTQEDVRALTGPPIPLVLSLAGSTANFSVTESLADTWVMQPGAGAVTFIGSSSSIEVFEQQNELEKQFFKKLFENLTLPVTLGEALHVGLEKVGSRYPENSRQNWEAYHLFGDPSLQMVLGPKPPDYSLTVSPEQLSLCGDGQAQTSLQVTGLYGFNTPVTLSVPELPQGMSALIQPNPILPGETAALTITAEGLDLNSYWLTVQGDADGLVRTTPLLISIDGRAPTAVNLLEPPAFSLNTSLRPLFSWDTVADAASYEIEIAGDHLFQFIEITAAGIPGTGYIPPEELSWGTTYWWRVRGVNQCGPGAYSLPRRFTTQSVALTCPGGSPETILAADFESGRSGWSTYGSGNTWALTDDDSLSPVWSFFASSKVTLPGEQTLDSPDILLPGLDQAPIKLGFWSRHSFENALECRDGGLLEISTNGGTGWQAIPEEYILSIPYDGVISSAHQNPLGGRSAWCGMREWSHFTVNLDAYQDREVRLRWRLGTDDSTPEGEGWYIDNVVVQSCRYPPPPGVTLEPASAHQTGIPGQTLSYALQATNTGPQPADFEVTAQGGQWATVVDPVLLSLDPGQSGQVIVTVSIPEDAAAGAVDRSEVNVLYTLDHAVHATAVINTSVLVYALSLTSPQSEKRGWPGQTVTFSVQVTNDGSTQDSVDLRLDSPDGWSVDPLISLLELAAGETRDVLVKVVIPADAADGTSKTLTLAATSQGNPAVSESLDLRIIVAYPRFYLPLVMAP